MITQTVTIDGRAVTDPGVLELDRDAARQAVLPGRRAREHRAPRRSRPLRGRRRVARGGAGRHRPARTTLIPSRVVRSIAFKGDVGLPDRDLHDRIKEHFGNTPSLARLPDLLTYLKTVYRDEGYESPKLTARPALEGAAHDELVIDVDAGSRLRIRHIQAEGNTPDGLASIPVETAADDRRRLPEGRGRRPAERLHHRAPGARLLRGARGPRAEAHGRRHDRRCRRQHRLRRPRDHRLRGRRRAVPHAARPGPHRARGLAGPGSPRGLRQPHPWLLPGPGLSRRRRHLHAYPAERRARHGVPREEGAAVPRRQGGRDRRDRHPCGRAAAEAEDEGRRAVRAEHRRRRRRDDRGGLSPARIHRGEGDARPCCPCPAADRPCRSTVELAVVEGPRDDRVVHRDRRRARRGRCRPARGARIEAGSAVLRAAGRARSRRDRLRAPEPRLQDGCGRCADSSVHRSHDGRRSSSPSPRARRSSSVTCSSSATSARPPTRFAGRSSSRRASRSVTPQCRTASGSSARSGCSGASGSPSSISERRTSGICSSRSRKRRRRRSATAAASRAGACCDRRRDRRGPGSLRGRAARVRGVRPPESLRQEPVAEPVRARGAPIARDDVGDRAGRARADRLHVPRLPRARHVSGAEGVQHAGRLPAHRLSRAGRPFELRLHAQGRPRRARAPHHAGAERLGALRHRARQRVRRAIRPGRPAADRPPLPAGPAVDRLGIRHPRHARRRAGADAGRAARRGRRFGRPLRSGRRSASSSCSRRASCSGGCPGVAA